MSGPEDDTPNITRDDPMIAAEWALGLLEGEDVLDTARAMRAFGAEAVQEGPGAWRVNGVGVGGFMEPEDVIDCGNSGTGVRLIMGAVATSDISVTFTGDASLSRRPMRRITDPLQLFGAEITAREGGLLPVTIRGARDAMPVRYATSYEFRPGPDCPLPVTPKDPAFHRCYVSVGDFPEVNVGPKWLYTRILTAFGAGLVPIL